MKRFGLASEATDPVGYISESIGLFLWQRTVNEFVGLPFTRRKDRKHVTLVSLMPDGRDVTYTAGIVVGRPSLDVQAVRRLLNIVV